MELGVGSWELAVGSLQYAVDSWQLQFENIFDMGTFRDLIVYKKAFQLAMEIFEMTKKFPIEERYSLIDQIRRSSRSVCICLAEGYRKRRYVAHFVAKTTDSDMENTETQGWLDFSLACKYINDDL